MHPARRSFRDELSATILRLVAYLGGIAILAFVAAAVFGEAAVEAALQPARSDWTQVERPYRAFALPLPDFAEPDYAIRRHVTGGGRKDVLTWGETGGAGSRLMLEIYRPGKEIKHFGTPSSEIAARAAELGALGAVKPAAPIESKFGSVALASFTASADGRARSCLGFARTFDDPRMEIAGWYCKGADEVIDNGVLACAIERLSLLAAASEPKVQDLFARAEIKRKPCGAKPVGHAGKRLDWLETSRAPKLRGRQATR